MQEKTEVALIACIFLCYYYYYFFTHKHPCFFPFQLLCCCAKQEIHTQEKKVWYHVKVFINASCLAESESLNTFLFTGSKNTIYELLLFFKSLQT